VNTVLLRLTALLTWPGPTISITKLWRAGLSIAVTRPSATANPYTIQSSIRPLKVRTANPAASRPAALWVT